MNLEERLDNAEGILYSLKQGRTVEEEPVAEVNTEEQTPTESPWACKKLSPDEAGAIIKKLIEEEESLNLKLAEMQKQIDVLKTKVPTMDTKIAEPEVEKADLEKKPEQISGYEVKAGDYLRKRAERSEIYGYGQYARWKDIYKANRDQIRNPDLILPGWILIIPRP
jgi:LysM repeat protein